MKTETLIKKGLKSALDRTSSINIYQITGVNVEEQNYTIKQLNNNKVYEKVEVVGLGLGHGKGQLMLLEENDLVLVGFLAGQQVPYILGSVFNNFMTENDYKIPIKSGEYFVGSKANGSYIYLKEDGSVNIASDNLINFGRLAGNKKIQLNVNDGSITKMDGSIMSNTFKITVSSTAPSSPNVGDVWIDNS